MLAVTMIPPTPQIQTQGLHDLATISTSNLDSSTSDQMLVTPTSALSPNKRPKLSLQTSSVPIAVGRSSTALAVSMSALQGASPTIRNTFNNAYDIPHRPSPVQPTPASSKWPKPMVSNITRREDPPYELPLNVRGILKNAPYIPSIRRTTWSATKSSSPRSSRRVFFPATKKVTWRLSLEEEVKTVKFIARHSDLPSDKDWEPEGGEHYTSSLQDTPSLVNDGQKRIGWTRMGTPVVNQCEDHPSGSESEGEGTDPSGKINHSKRKRKPPEWRWTLGTFDEDDDCEDDGDLAKPEKESRRTPDPISAGLRLTIDTAKIRRLVMDHGEDPLNTPFPFELVTGNTDDAAMSSVS